LIVGLIQARNTSAFMEYCAKFGKHYPSKAEWLFRQETFMLKDAYINSVNR